MLVCVVLRVKYQNNDNFRWFGYFYRQRYFSIKICYRTQAISKIYNRLCTLMLRKMEKIDREKTVWAFQVISIFRCIFEITVPIRSVFFNKNISFNYNYRKRSFLIVLVCVIKNVIYTQHVSQIKQKKKYRNIKTFPPQTRNILPNRDFYCPPHSFSRYLKDETNLCERNCQCFNIPSNYIYN